jgi:hypothetical protein
MKSDVRIYRSNAEADDADGKNILLEGLEIPVISVSDLIANERPSGRSQDLADVEKLESASKRG